MKWHETLGVIFLFICTYSLQVETTSKLMKQNMELEKQISDQGYKIKMLILDLHKYEIEKEFKKESN